MVDEQVCNALASVGNRVLVVVGHTGSDVTHVADAVIVAVGLRWVCDRGTVVGGIGPTIAVGIDWWRALDCDRVAVAPRDA
jgi:hypothetical protein